MGLTNAHRLQHHKEFSHQIALRSSKNNFPFSSFDIGYSILDIEDIWSRQHYRITDIQHPKSETYFWTLTST